MGTESVVKLEILFLGLALGALLLLKQPPLRAGLVAALPVGRTAGLAEGEAGLILKMYKNGFTAEQIAAATDKDVKEVEGMIAEKL